MSNTSQMPGQEKLQGMENLRLPASPMHKNMNARRAFGGLVTPEYWRIDPANYENITDQMVELVAPYMLRGDLMGIAKPDPDQYVVDSIALSPVEYKFVPRGIAAIGRTVTSTALSGKLQLASPGAGKERAADKKANALHRYHDKTLRYLEHTLQPQKESLEFLVDMARAPGYSRGRHIDIHQKVTLARDVIFPEMLDVVGDQRGWNEDQRTLAGRALDKRLLMTGKRRVGNWREWLKFAVQYNDARQNIFKRRIKEIERHLG